MVVIIIKRKTEKNWKMENITMDIENGNHKKRKTSEIETFIFTEKKGTDRF